jgi:hypothetical protein
MYWLQGEGRNVIRLLYSLLPVVGSAYGLVSLYNCWTDRGLVYSAKLIFNNILYVIYLHLTKGQAYSQETDPPSRLRGCYIRTMTARVQLQKEISGREPQRTCQDEIMGGKPPVVK